MARRTLDDILRGSTARKPSDERNAGDLQLLEDNRRRMMSAYGNEGQQQWARDNDEQQREAAQRQAAREAFVPQSLRGTVYDQRLVQPYAPERQRQDTDNPLDKAEDAIMTGRPTPPGKPAATATPDGLSSLATLRRRMEAARQLTPEQKEKLAKRRKREAVFSAIGDGLSALSNLFFTTKYAPNVQGQGKLSEKNQARWEKWDKERKEGEKDYAAALQKAEAAEAELRRKKDKDDADLGLKRKADERADQLNRARMAKYQAGQEKDENMAKLYEAKAKALEDGAEKEAELLQAKIDKLKADADAARKRGEAALINARANQTRAARSGGNGRGRRGYDSGRGKYFAYDSNGNIHWFETDKTAEDYAIEQGTWVEDTSTTSTTTTQYGIPTTNTRTQRSGWHSQRPPGNGGGGNSYRHTRQLGL